MGDTWIVDLQHYLTPTGAFAPMPKEARRLAEYFASIVLDTTGNVDGPSQVHCRRRPKRRLCNTPLVSLIDPQNEGIRWWCPTCHDNGLISGWQNTLWDGSKEPLSVS